MLLFTQQRNRYLTNVKERGFLMLSQQEFEKRLKSACATVVAAQDELTRIDSQFGDADHGITMSRIAETIREAVQRPHNSIQEMLDDVAGDVMMLNGGSAVPLWYTWLDGMQQNAPKAEEMSDDQLRAMLVEACHILEALSKAKVGDKTMMDTLIPATQAAADCPGGSEEIFQAAAKAAREGAENTKNFVSKFGRARSYGTATIGTPDAGAVSMMYFFAGLANP